MAKSVLSSRAWTVLLVALSGLCAFALRVVIPYQAVFGGDTVSFLETDAWYHMRLVDALVRDFPTGSGSTRISGTRRLGSRGAFLGLGHCGGRPAA
jgi:asparagine N-glycosylation enzyme membrane subunit Stt3